MATLHSPLLGLLGLLLACLAAASTSAAAASPATSSTSLVAAQAADLILGGGASVTSNPLANLRSGNPKQRATASFAIPLTAGAVITGVSFDYQYMTGFGPAGVGANFSLVVAGTAVYSSPHLTDHTYAPHAPLQTHSPCISIAVSTTADDSGARAHTTFASRCMAFTAARAHALGGELAGGGTATFRVPTALCNVSPSPSSLRVGTARARPTTAPPFALACPT